MQCESQLLDIAAEQIARTGYAGLSVGDVAMQAGVSKPLVYAYFDTKDATGFGVWRLAGGIVRR
ncbi:helix-turn-helix domain-containing protein [Hoyosella altamirensis]|uniref:AcrR family transcriptional regulator n=1 Tax=Hoyosella altamirensis TaxID=616997 RepID=A0A839RLS8_9ACTN|nr:helix-turn-helix domain-containing protein [Hoyosella altamirensis]MBB3037104.1 AcrR family transcriptional regulator [Hoyosella altamirensis]